MKCAYCGQDTEADLKKLKNAVKGNKDWEITVICQKCGFIHKFKKVDR